MVRPKKKKGVMGFNKQTNSSSINSIKSKSSAASSSSLCLIGLVGLVGLIGFPGIEGNSSFPQPLPPNSRAGGQPRAWRAVAGRRPEALKPYHILILYVINLI